MSLHSFIKLIESEDLLNGRYKDINAIDSNGGNGAFSIVFKAKDVKTNSDVVLKFYDPDQFGNSERVKRFEREAEMLKELEGEEYVIGYIEGLSTYNFRIKTPKGINISFPYKYIAMELADYSIEELIYNSTIDPIVKLVTFKEILKSVTRLHQRRICHRDLKPSNFLVKGVTIKLSDFGTAKKIDSSLPNINKNYIQPVGDVNYTSPEPFLGFGIADEYVFLADFFSLGAILFEMFTLSVFTNEIYTPAFLGELYLLKNRLQATPYEQRRQIYSNEIKKISRSFKYPDIYSYNDEVPKCIKNQLNYLYTKLANINIEERLNNIISIHRQLDICIITLRNEQDYVNWLEEKRKRKIARSEKIFHRLRRINDTKKSKNKVA